MYIRIFLFIFSYNCFSQILSPTVAVHHKKEASFPEQSYTLSFDGTNDRVDDTGVTLNNLVGFTLELWINADHAGSNIGIIGEDNLIECTFVGDAIRIWANPIRKNSITWNFNSSEFPFGAWNHVAFVGDASASSGWLKIYINGKLVKSGGANPGSDWGKGHNPRTAPVRLAKDIQSNGDNYFDGKMDEVRIWSEARTLEEINYNMFKHLNGDEGNLMAYYQMSDASGTTLTDNSTNSKNGTLINMDDNDWVTSNVPLADLPSAYQNNVVGLWKSIGTADSDTSDGLSLSVDIALSNDFIILGNNDNNGTSASSILDLNLISDRVWYFEEIGDVTADVKIDISEATGYSGGETLTANNYKLLFKTCVMCDYSDISDGLSISVNGTDITFSNVIIKDGYYSIGSKDTNL